MCGISGVYAPHDPPSKNELKSMNACQCHRGPDSEDYFLNDPIGFAHSRLSIIGLDTGNQPIENETGSVVVIFNGEIYSYPQLRDELESVGHTFTTDTDTEVLVHLYEEHGPSFVSRLDGMFAFALWDRDKNRLVLARDPLGIKPLLLADDGHRIGFASELPSLLQSNVDQGGLDETAIAEYFSLGFVPSPKTAFENVRKVQPGELVTVSNEKTKRTHFYEPSIDVVSDSFEDASSTLRELVTDAVEKRMMSDVPLGAFLSGGIDSSIITGIMSKLSADPVRTFTVGFADDRYDESDIARSVAEYNDTNHTEYVVSSDDVREVVPSVLGQLGEPFADPSLIPTYVVARKTSQDVKVALSGDGADELFAGYNRYRGEYYSQLYRSLPNSIRSMMIEPMVDRLPASRDSQLGEIFRKGQVFVDASVDDIRQRHFQWVRKDSDETDSAYVNCNPTAAGSFVIDREHDTITEWLPKKCGDDLDRIMAVDTYHGLPNQMLQKVDLASMYNSLETRVPFLDTAVVEYALGLPSEFKITPRNRKRILKHTFEDVLPHEVFSRSKQGFDMPIGNWLKNDLAHEFRSTVTESTAAQIDTEAVLDLHNQHTGGRRDHEWFLWNVYVFAQWHRRMVSKGHLPE